ncbi:MAG: sugar phosphate isomerase/epimerase [Gemmatimonadetes bacterium]|nr:sugar phosphate isomerase/epimerase [Gemmatimonadota bacterium]
MTEQSLGRRAFLAAAGGAALALPAAAQALSSSRTPTAAPDMSLKLGVASYSLRSFPRAKAIEMVKALRTPFVNIKSVHLDYPLSAAELQAGRREFEAAGLTIVGGGTITFSKGTDEEARMYFEYAKNAGMPLIVATGNPTFLPRIERFSREYGIKVAIHNHGPEDKFYPSPYDVLRHVQNMHPNMGLCMDIGHTVRAGADIVKAAADAGPRLLDVHAKDLTDFTNRDSQVAVGEGNIPVAAFFRQLRAMRYQGHVNLEYEINANDPLPGMMLSFAHMRGILAGLTAAGMS